MLQTSIAAAFGSKDAVRIQRDLETDLFGEETQKDVRQLHDAVDNMRGLSDEARAEAHRQIEQHYG